MKRLTLIIILALCSFSGIFSQEMNFTVKINTAKLQTVDPKVFATLEKTIEEFLNSQKWTNDVYEQEERIECNLILTIQEELSASSFQADMAIQASRPIYGSSYKSPIFNHLDNSVRIDYEQYQPLVYSKTNYVDNLSSILSYYVYIILGLDYDSFSPLGGQKHFQQAQDILNAVPRSVQSTYGGWDPAESNRNRYWLVENLLSPRVTLYRKAMYTYHRQGLDLLSSDLANGRGNIVFALEDLTDVNQAYPNCMILQVFNATKSTELLEIFTPAPLGEQQKVIQVMSRIDPSNASKYRRMKS